MLVLGTNIAVRGIVGCSKSSSRQCDLLLILILEVSGDLVIRETPASRGTETSAEVLVGPPGG